MPDNSKSPGDVRIVPLRGIPIICEGDDLPRILVRSLRDTGLAIARDDILVVTQKIVSKSEGRLVRLSGIVPSARAVELAEKIGKDPRKVEVILRESRRVVRAQRSAKSGVGVLICETHHGFICANAGVDESNLSDPGTVLLLPADPDASAEKLRREIGRISASGAPGADVSDIGRDVGVDLGVIITDSFGRPWRLGIVNVAIGVAGCPALVDYRGREDFSGRMLSVTEIAVADEIAAVAGLVMGKLEQIPAALVRGLRLSAPSGCATDLRRVAEEDLFR